MDRGQDLTQPQNQQPNIKAAIPHLITQGKNKFSA